MLNVKDYPQLALRVLLLSGLLLGPAPQDAPPAQTSQRMERVGDLGGLVSAVTTDGVTALVAEGESLLRLDAFREGRPEVIASVNLERGGIQQVVEAFPLTYVLTEEGLLVMQGVHDAPLPQPVAFVPGGGQAMTPGAGVVYVAAREAGLRVIDVSVPQQARVLSEAALPGQAEDLALSPDGALAFVAAGAAGLHVVDVRNPADPQMLAVLDTAGSPNAIRVANTALGPLLFVGSGEGVVALSVPDADQPDQAGMVGQYTPLSAGRAIVISPDGAFAYVAAGEGGLKVYDVARPDQALEISSAPPANTGGALDVALSPDGDVALVASGQAGLRIFDVGNPYSPVERFVVALPGTAEGVAFSQDEGLAFVALGEGGLALVDVTTAAVRGVVPLAGHAAGVVAEGRWAYVASGEAGLSVLRVDPGGVGTVVATLPLPGDARRLWLQGDTLFVAGGEAGLQAVDVVRPGEPRLVGELAPETQGGRYVDIGISGKRAYIADGQGVAVVDVADPARMVHLTRIEGGSTGALALAEQGIDVFLYALSGSQLAAYEVSVSTQPVLLGVRQPIEGVGRIIPHGDQLLLTNTGDGPQVVVLNVSNPRLPREDGWYGEVGHSLDAAAHGDAVLVAGGLEGLAVLGFDDERRLGALGVHNPLPDLTRVVAGQGWVLAGGEGGWSLVDSQQSAHLRPLSRSEGSLRVRGLARQGDEVVVVAGQTLASFDVSDPSDPRLLHERAFGGLANDVTLDDRHVFVADGTGGLEVFTRDELRPVTRVPLPAGASAVALAPGSGLAYLALDDGMLAAVDVAEPTGGLRSLGTLSLDAPASLSPAPEAGNALALAGRELSLLDVEASGSGDLVRLEQVLLPRVGRGVALDGERLVVPMVEGGIDLYTLIDAGRPALVDTLPGGALAVAARGGTLYLAQGEAGLATVPAGASAPVVVDDARPVSALLMDGEALYGAGEQLIRYEVRDNGSLREMASVALSGPAQHIALGGAGGDGTRWLYVSTVNGIDVVRQAADDGSLELVSQVALPSGVRKLISGGNRAYAALLAGGLLVLSTADPGQPVPLFTYRSEMGAAVQDLLPVGGRLLVSWEGGLEVLDVGTPSALPSLVAAVPTGGARALDVTLAGERAYVSLGQDGIAIVDVSQPAEARVMATLDTPGVAGHAAVAEGTLFIADGPCGVRAVDVSQPFAPQERGFWLTGFTNDVAFVPGDGILYAANGNSLLALRYLPGGPPVPPPTPRDPLPLDGATAVPMPVELGWGPSPDTCNPLRYEVSLGVDTSPPLLGQVTGAPTLSAGRLRGLTTYHWQVRAIDFQGDQAQGPAWSFTTERGGLGAFVQPDAPPVFLGWLRGIGWVPLVVVASLGVGVLVIRRRRRRGNGQ